MSPFTELDLVFQINALGGLQGAGAQLSSPGGGEPRGVGGDGGGGGGEDSQTHWAGALRHTWGQLSVTLQRGNAQTFANRIPNHPLPPVDGLQ